MQSLDERRGGAARLGGSWGIRRPRGNRGAGQALRGHEGCWCGDGGGGSLLRNGRGRSWLRQESVDVCVEGRMERCVYSLKAALVV